LVDATQETATKNDTIFLFASAHQFSNVDFRLKPSGARRCF
jgi:hypothetical protein